MKKGFTLIELLAVIVILAIIAVIAVPIVLDIIDDSKKNASLRSAEMYMKALELEIANKGMNNEKYEDGVYSIDEFEIEIKGEKPTSGFIQIINGEIDKYSLIINEQQVSSKEEYKVWNGNPSNLTSIEELEKDENGNYLINSPEELAWLAQEVNLGTTYEGYNFYLNANLDLNNKEWTPIGNKNNTFGGNFYGNNHIIKNINVDNVNESYKGLFGLLKIENGVQIINNLIIKNSKISGKSSVAPCVGVSRSNVILDNITSFNNELTAVEHNAGGIVGQTAGTLKNCKSIFNLIKTGTLQAGGIVGFCHGIENTENRKIENCYTDSTTKIYCKGKTNDNLGFITSYAGGIAGSVDYCDIYNVFSNATIIAEGSHVGGIAGQITNLSSVENAKTGPYSYVEGTKVIGGIVGHISYDSILKNAFSDGIIVYNENSHIGDICGDTYESICEKEGSTIIIKAKQ